MQKKINSQGLWSVESLEDAWKSTVACDQDLSRRRNNNVSLKPFQNYPTPRSIPVLKYLLLPTRDATLIHNVLAGLRLLINVKLVCFVAFSSYVHSFHLLLFALAGSLQPKH